MDSNQLASLPESFGSPTIGNWEVHFYNNPVASAESLNESTFPGLTLVLVEPDDY